MFKKSLLPATLSVLLVAACTDNTNNTSQSTTSAGLTTKSNIIFDFEKSTDLPQTENSTTKLINTDGVTSGKQALAVTFSKQELGSSISFIADKPMDWSKAGFINLATDITNPSDVSVHLYIEISDASDATP